MNAKSRRRAPKEETGVIFREKRGGWTCSVSARTKGAYHYLFFTSDPEGKRQERWFKERGHAMTAAEKFVNKLVNDGAEHAGTDKDELAALIKWRTWAAKQPSPPRLSDVVAKAIGDLERERTPWTVKEASDDRKASAKRAGASDRHQSDLSERLKRFADSFGDRQLADMTTSEIEAWLYGLGLSPQSFANFRRVVYSVFALAVKKGLIQTNPVANVTGPKIKRQAPTIISPDELGRVLLAADEQLRALLVLQAFCGCRRAEANRLTWQHIHLDDDHAFVELPDAVTKTGRRRTADLPAVAVAWLKPLAKKPKVALGLSQGKYRFRLEAAADQAGVEWDENILRHSFGTYRLAATRNAALVSSEMGNSPAVVQRHYVSIVAPKVAEEYWCMTPERAAANAEAQERL